MGPDARSIKTCIAIVSLAIACASATAIRAAENAPWLTGEMLRQQLDLPIGLQWSGTSLRESLQRLGETQRLAIFLDRRVDPGRELHLALVDVPLKQALEQIAGKLDLGVCLVGPVAYFGPPRTTERLRTLAALRGEDVDSLPPAARATFRRLRPSQWEDLATPRGLLEGLAQESGLRMEGLDRVPHDLWPAADWPPLSLTDRLTLIGAGFDLTFRIGSDGERIQWVPIDEPVRLVRSYSAGRQARPLAERLSKTLAGARVEVSGEKIVVRGRLEDHEVAQSMLAGSPSRQPARPADRPAGKKVYTLTVREQPVGPLVEHIAKQVGLELKMDRDAIERGGRSLQTRVSLEVKGVTLDELLEASLAPAGLSFTRDDKAIEVRAAERD